MEEDAAERLYRKKLILAPMVRASTLPLRRLALQYGADTVYTEEIIDHKLLRLERSVNAKLGTIDYLIPPRPGQVGKKCKTVKKRLTLRIDPKKEAGRLVLQIGTSDAVRALKAAQVVARDVSGVDVNMGCPKHFSLSGGMGAALLRKPEVACDIIRTLRRNLSVPVSCKIRMLDADAGERMDKIAGSGVAYTRTESKLNSVETTAISKRIATSCDDSASKTAPKRAADELDAEISTSPQRKKVKRTLSQKRKSSKKKQNSDVGVALDPKELSAALTSTRRFMRQMEAAGAAAVAVHMRTTSERPGNPAHLDTESLQFLGNSIKVPFIVNGDAFTRESIRSIRDVVPGASIMFARGALRNPSVFRAEGTLPRRDVVREYVREAIRCENHVLNTKYFLMQSLKHGNLTKGAEWNAMHGVRSYEDICGVLGLDLEKLRLSDESVSASAAAPKSDEAYAAGHVYKDSYFNN